MGDLRIDIHPSESGRMQLASAADLKFLHRPPQPL